MIITSINVQNFQAKKLVPISQYQGPILKLTKKDKEKIALLLDKKTQISFELYGVTKLLEKNHKTITREWQHLSIVQSKLMGEIDRINNMIKEIKIARLNKQKKNLSKLDTKA